MRGLTLMHTVDGTSADLPSRVARYAWPKPPSPRSRSMRYRRPVSGLSIAWPDTSSRCPRAIGTLIDRVVRVVAVEGWRAMRGKLYQAAMRARYFGPRAHSGHAGDHEARAAPLEVFTPGVPGGSARRQRDRTNGKMASSDGQLSGMSVPVNLVGEHLAWTKYIWPHQTRPASLPWALQRLISSSTPRRTRRSSWRIFADAPSSLRLIPPIGVLCAATRWRSTTRCAMNSTNTMHSC